MLKTRFLLLHLLLSLTSVFAQQFYLPEVGDDDHIVFHKHYILSYNEDHEQADWVAYELTEEKVRGTARRVDRFREDPFVITGSAVPGDYRGSGFDRGHLAPAADMKITDRAMSESFYMSNMSPQTPSFNRGIWNRLEGMVRQWALANESIYVVTGPVLEEGLSAIGDNEVSVPRYYYKVILDYTEPELKGIAFLMPNEGSSLPVEEFAVTIDEVEQRTGINFFPALPDEMEPLLEGFYDISLWDFTPYR